MRRRWPVPPPGDSIRSAVQQRDDPDAPALPSAVLDALEAEIEAMRVAYDKYFTGVERIAPTRARERLDRKIRGLENLALKTTALRFRCGALRARYVSYAHYWARVLDQIERGVWRRDLARAGARPAVEPVAAAASVEPEPAAAAPPAPTVIDPSHAREVFEKLVATKRQLGESTDGLTFPAFLRRLHREVPRLAGQQGTGSLRFDVDIKDGKVRIRARTAT